MVILGWAFAIPVLYYFSIFPVVLVMGLCFEDLSHAPGPVLMTISNFYYPWGLLADNFPVLGMPLDFLENLAF